MPLKPNYNKDSLLEPYSMGMLKDFYLTEKENSPQEAFLRACIAWSKYKGILDEDLAKRLYEHCSNKHFMFASPVLSNAPNGTKQGKGLPISCFLGYVGDSIDELINHTSELRYLSVYGGGIGGHWSDVRTVSDIAPGPIPFIHTVDSDIIAYRQGKTRKGSYAAYMDVSHPDIIEFLNLRIPTGDVQRKALNIHNAVNISDDFMNCVIENKEWHLKDPKDGSIKDTINSRKLWERILEIRFRTGEPFICNIDIANKYLPENLKKIGLKINGSNLCTEIFLPTNELRTAVCCLSSPNLEYFDEWKNTTMIRDMVRMLDNVLEYFIENAPDTISRAKFSAMRERSIGLGAMGFHSLLQKHGVAWESDKAKEINLEVFKHIKEEALKETTLLAKERGEYPDGEGTGRRNAHLLAIAPNASTGIILATSPSIEPHKANAYTHRTRAGSFLVKNKYLEKILQERGINNDAIWTSIITNKGSVQHIPELSEGEKSVFKTADEIDQNAIIDRAAERQPYICQGQSVNLFFPAGAQRSYVNEVHINAWKKGLKSLYYLRTEAKSRAEKVSEKVERVALQDDNRTIVYGKSNCPFCTMAKDELSLRGIPFEYIDLEQIGKTAAEVTGRKVKTVPQIYLEGNYIGGYEDLMKIINIPTSCNLDGECRSCEG